MADAMRDLLQRSLNRIEDLQSCEADELEVEALVQDLHAALAEQPTQPAGRCSYCLTYNGHQDGCIYAPPAPSVPDDVAAAARHFKAEGGHIGGLGVSRAANILFDYISGVLAAAPEVKP